MYVISFLIFISTLKDIGQVNSIFVEPLLQKRLFLQPLNLKNMTYNKIVRPLIAL